MTKSKREQQRIATTKKNHGSDIFIKAGHKGGSATWANIKKKLGSQ